MTARKQFIIFSVVALMATLLAAYFWQTAYWLLIIIVPLILLGVSDMVQRKRTILRLYPVVGHMRFFFESIRTEIQQYFVESNTNGMPVSREFRSLVYQRAKGQRDTRPFGTQFDVYKNGYEWLEHSLAPQIVQEKHPKIRFGGEQCSQPYDASPLNISAMSFGALSKNAIMALNKGAKTGGFAHNTGEGSMSPYHIKYGGDLIWQIGTGYFGCRDNNGVFDSALFEKNATKDVVKMIEIKLSQGAKPGHGGILPAAKLTQEIADIRHVPMGHDVISPPAHSAFSSPIGLLEFVCKLRKLSGGKPVGFKLCVGRKSEFMSICKAMLETGITPDFITIDGSEGGTGAAPVELTNSVGMPLKDALLFVDNILIGMGLRNKIRLIASGKAMSAFQVLRLLALGADTVNSARAMMFALGCIQSRHCNEDNCPTGIATQDPARYKQLDVDDKSARVANYHSATVRNMMELLATAGLCRLDELRPWHISRRISAKEVSNYAKVYPQIEEGCLLSDETMPNDWKNMWGRSSSKKW